MIDYEAMLQSTLPEYNQVKHTNVHEAIIATFLGSGYEKSTFDYKQQFNFAGLKGRLLSSSYMPMPDQANYAAVIAQLQKLYNLHAVDDRVPFSYKTQVYSAVVSA